MFGKKTRRPENGDRPEKIRKPARNDLDALLEPWYSLEQAAKIADVEPSKITEWAQPPDFIIGFPDRAAEGELSISFIGMAELLVMAVIDPGPEFLEHFYPVLPFLEMKFGREHPLAHTWMRRNGAKLAWEYYNLYSRPENALPMVKIGFNDAPTFVVQLDLLLSYSFSHNYRHQYVERIQLRQYTTADVFIDPAKHNGAPHFYEGESRVEDVVECFLEGKSLVDCSKEYNVPVFQIEDVLNVQNPPTPKRIDTSGGDL